MSICGYKRLTLLLAVVVVVLIGLVWHFDMRFQMQRLDERGAWNTIADFERSQSLALRSEPKIAAEMLDDVAHHPPKWSTGSLGMMVEQARADSIHGIIDYLRKKTGEDLGDDPEKWIEKYEKYEK
jgi:hypothetical protein